MSNDGMIDVTLSGFPLQVDPEKSWRRFLTESFTEQLETACEDFHWVVQLHRVDLPLKAKEAFWAKYQEPAAHKARRAAIHGLCWVNYKKERDLLNEAIRTHEQMQEDRATEPWAKPLGEQMRSFGYLGMQIAELVAAGDYKAFTRMAAIIEHQGTPSSDKPRGGEESGPGLIYREFCQFHVNTRSLPTKKQLRNACGLGNDADDLEKARRMMVKLGLSGLPEA